MRFHYILISLFLCLFLLISITPVYAKLPISINQTVVMSSDYCQYISCVNASEDNNIFCQVACGDYPNPATLYRWDINVANQQSCDLTAGNSWGFDGAMVNKSWSYGVLGGTYLYLYNTSNLTGGSGDCSNYSQENIFPVATATDGLTFYSGADRWIYAGESGQVVTELPSSSFEGYTGIGDCRILDFANDTDNTTLWCGKAGMTKFVNGVWDGSNNISRWDIWGFSNPTSWSLVYINESLTWGYFIEDVVGVGNTYFIYRVNFTQAEELSPSFVTAIQPLNLSYPTGQYCYQVGLETQTNGTLRYWVNGTNVYNQTIVAPFDSQVSYCTFLAEGNGYWYAEYLDITSLDWDSETYYFTITGAGVVTAIGGYITNFLDLDSIDDGLILIGLILTLIIAGSFAIKVKSNHGAVFLGVAGLCILVFSVIGWMPSWLGLVMIIMIAGIFALMITKVTGG